MNLSRFFKGRASSEADGQDGTTPYEEVGEKRTTVVGYILLVLMAIFIVSIGQTVFGDISDIPKKPEKISACTQKLRDIVSSEEEKSSYRELQSYNFSEFESEDERYPDCVFSKYETTVGITGSFPSISAALSDYRRADKEIDRLDREVSRANESYTQGAGNYGIGLEEKQAGVKPRIDTEEAGRQFTQSSEALAALQEERSREIEKRDAAVAEMRRLFPHFAELYRKTLSLQNRDYSLYSIKVFLLSLLFVLPFFVASLRFYLRSKKDNSPYTVIAGAIVAASSVLLLQVVFGFLSDIIPHRLIELFFKFFARFAFLRYVLYYGSVILVILLFGGIVFYIQKRVFHPSVIAVRRIKDRKCPSCSFSIGESMRFCPKCARPIRHDCSSCGKPRFKDLPVCEHCGVR